LVERDMRVEKNSTERRIVTDTQARLNGVHTRIERGTTRIATARKTLRDFAAAEIRF
jgi:hypothetical protein